MGKKKTPAPDVYCSQIVPGLTGNFNVTGQVVKTEISDPISTKDGRISRIATVHFQDSTGQSAVKVWESNAQLFKIYPQGVWIRIIQGYINEKDVYNNQLKAFSISQYGGNIEILSGPPSAVPTQPVATPAVISTPVQSVPVPTVQLPPSQAPAPVPTVQVPAAVPSAFDTLIHNALKPPTPVPALPNIPAPTKEEAGNYYPITELMEVIDKIGTGIVTLLINKLDAILAEQKLQTIELKNLNASLNKVIVLSPPEEPTETIPEQKP